MGRSCAYGVVDLGKTVGSLTALVFVDCGTMKLSWYLCQCSCGSDLRVVRASNLKLTKSCGCSRTKAFRVGVDQVNQVDSDVLVRSKIFYSLLDKTVPRRKKSKGT